MKIYLPEELRKLAFATDVDSRKEIHSVMAFYGKTLEERIKMKPTERVAYILEQQSKGPLTDFEKATLLVEAIKPIHAAFEQAVQDPANELERLLQKNQNEETGDGSMGEAAWGNLKSLYEALTGRRY